MSMVYLMLCRMLLESVSFFKKYRTFAQINAQLLICSARYIKEESFVFKDMTMKKYIIKLLSEAPENLSSMYKVKPFETYTGEEIALSEYCMIRSDRP